MARKRRRKKSRKSVVSFTGIKDICVNIFHFFFLHIGIIFLCALVLSCALWFKDYCIQSNAFSVSRIEINQTQVLTQQEIIDSSTIKMGDNIFLLNIRSIAKKVQAIPRVKRAEVRRVLPRTIVIDVLERREIAQIKLPSQKNYYLIDSEGCILPPISNEPRTDLIIIEAQFSSLNFLRIGDFYWNEGVENGLKLAKNIQNHPILSKEIIKSIKIDRGLNMIILLADDIEILVGKDTSDNLIKLTNVHEVLSPEKRSQVKYIDLRFMNVVVKTK
jgi:cell division protein FtsQ